MAAVQEQVQDNATVDSALAISPETETYAVYRESGKTALGFGVYKEGNALFKAAQPGPNGEAPTVEILATKEVTYPVFHTIEGINQAFDGNDEEAVRLFNDGCRKKLIPQLRSQFAEVTEGGDLINADVTSISYDDAMEILTTPLKRQKQTDAQKLRKVLSGIDPNVLAETLKAMGIAL